MLQRIKKPSLWLLVILVGLCWTPPSFADELEGIYRDGLATVTVRKNPNGPGYLVERRENVNGRDIVLTGQGRVEDGRLVADFGSDESTSARIRLKEVNGQDVESDIKVQKYVLPLRQAEELKISNLPPNLRNARNGSSPSEDRALPEFGQGQVNVNAQGTGSGGSKVTDQSDSGAVVNEQPKDNDNAPFAAGLALAAMVAAAGAASGTENKSKGEQRGQSPDISADLRVADAEAELQAFLEAEALANSSSVQWQEPELFEEADLQALTGREGGLNMAEKLILEYTNSQILEGGQDTDLAANFEQAKNFRARQYTAADAQALDGRSSRVFSPLEQEVLKYTNRQIAVGGTNVDLAENYRSYLQYYRDNQAAQDAATLFTAMKGAGTDEDAIFRTLAGKTTHQIELIKQAFDQQLRAQGESTRRGQYDSNLKRWLDAELGGGDYDKAIDAYNGRPIKENADYYVTSAIAKSVNEFIKDSDEGAKYMIEHGNLLEQGIGYLNQGIFGTAGFVNDSVKNAQEFYIREASQSDSGAVKFLANTGYVLATIGGSFGTKALDPTLDYSETEEGLVDLALLVGTFGLGKALQAGAKTAVGARALAKLSKSLQALSRLSYGLKRVVGLAGTSKKLTAAASKYRQLASATKNSERARRALIAAENFEKASAQALKAERAVSEALRLEKLAKAAVQTGSNADDAVLATQRAVEAAKLAKKEIEALRVAESLARRSASEASLLANNALARGYDATKARLLSDVGAQSRLYARISSNISDDVSNQVARELKRILNRNIGSSSGRMTGAQFNQIMDDLAVFAEKNGITISRTTETVGVYPKGLYEIQLAGFNKVDDLTGAVDFAKRHELAHIFHTLQARATIGQSLGQGQRLTGQALKEAEQFLKMMEEGSNYRQFEKAVTGISSAAHVTERTKNVALYGQRVESLIDNTRTGLHAGKVRFPNGLTYEETYAMFLSKAPAVVGTSLKSLSARMPAMLFGTLYASNLDANSYLSLAGLNVRDFGLEPGPSGSMGFRDFINALITEGYHPPE